MTTEAPRQELQAETVLTRDLGIWEYGASRDAAQGLWISINYDHNSASDLKAYVTANKALLPDVERLGGRAEIAITFNQPMPADQFRDWAKQNGVQVSQSQIAVGGSTMGIMGTVDDPLPQQSVDKFPHLSQSGIFGAYGTVDTNRLSALASDPKVFLVDVTPAWTRQDLAKADIAEATLPKTKVYVDLAFGYMEMNGMVALPTVIPGPIGTTVVPTLPPAP